jgi:hypothetical protein
MSKSNITLLLVALTIVFAAAGCSVTRGGMREQSRFVYPNSNVAPLGPTSASVSKTYFLLIPSIKVEDVKKTHADALAKVDGANALIDYHEDTTVSSIFLFNTITYHVEGTAVKMNVGKQTLN